MRGKRKVVLAVLTVFLAVGLILRVFSRPLAMLLGGYRDAVTIEEGFEYTGEANTRWRVILAEKDGENRLVVMEQGFLGFWELPTAADPLGGTYQGLEHISLTTVPACSPYYGYEYTTVADGDRTESYKYVRQHIMRSEWFYHGANAVMTLAVPEEALPRDAALQIYQAGPEYVLHLVMYTKGSGSFDGGFATLYQALLDKGCIE